MKIRSVQIIPASVPYTRRELSFQVARHRIRGRRCTRNGSLHCRMFSVGFRNDPPPTLALGRLAVPRGDGQLCLAGLDMALWDLCGQEAGVPVSKLLDGAVRDSVNYFYYLSWDDEEGIRNQCPMAWLTATKCFRLRSAATLSSTFAGSPSCASASARPRYCALMPTAPGPGRKLSPTSADCASSGSTSSNNPSRSRHQSSCDASATAISSRLGLM